MASAKYWAMENFHHLGSSTLVACHPSQGLEMNGHNIDTACVGSYTIYIIHGQQKVISTLLCRAQYWQNEYDQIAFKIKTSIISFECWDHQKRTTIRSLLLSLLRLDHGQNRVGVRNKMSLHSILGVSSWDHQNITKTKSVILSQLSLDHVKVE